MGIKVCGSSLTAGLVLLFVGCDSTAVPDVSVPTTQSNSETGFVTADPQVQVEVEDEDEESRDTPHFGATLVVNAARKGVNGGSIQTNVGRLSANSHVGGGDVSCGPESAVSHVTWKFLEHHDGADFYTFTWTLIDETDSTLKSTQRKIAYAGEKIVLVDDVHYIILKPQNETDSVETDDEE